jgi:cytoskeletal protein RodZ
MSLGSMISEARKDAGVSIDDLSASTNIRTTLLREIENNDFQHCGGETYARGHLRNIATKLGVNPQLFLDAFEEEQVHSSKTMTDLLVETSVMNQPDQPRKVSWKVLAAISIGSLFLVGIAQIIISNGATTEVPAPVPSASSSPSSSEPAPQESATTSTGTGVKVVIKASRAKSWLFVSDAAGTVLFSGQIQQGVSKTFTSDLSINLKVGNAGGVDLTVNGNEIESIGADGEVVDLSYGVDS